MTWSCHKIKIFLTFEIIAHNCLTIIQDINGHFSWLFKYEHLSKQQNAIENGDPTQLGRQPQQRQLVVFQSNFNIPLSLFLFVKFIVYF